MRFITMVETRRWTPGSVQLVVAQFCEAIQVGRNDTKQVVRLAEQPLCAPDLGHPRHARFECAHRAGVATGHRDLDECSETRPDRGRVNDGVMAGDDSGALPLPRPCFRDNLPSLSPDGIPRRAASLVVIWAVILAVARLTFGRGGLGSALALASRSR